MVDFALPTLHFQSSFLYVGPMKATSTASVVLTSSVSLYCLMNPAPHYTCLKSKLVVLQSLSTFLRHAVASPSRTSSDRLESPSESPIDTWYLASWFRTPEAYGVFDRLLQSRLAEKSPPRTWQAEVDLEFDRDTPCCYPLLGPIGSNWTLQQLSEIVDSTDSSESGENTSAFVRVSGTRMSDPELTITSILHEHCTRLSFQHF
jgi:pre-rRNA-processing protein IPI1